MLALMMDDALKYAAALRALNRKQRVKKPKVSTGCWIEIRTPSRRPCSKSARAGKLTCAHHDRFEDEAQYLKAEK